MCTVLRREGSMFTNVRPSSGKPRDTVWAALRTWQSSTARESRRNYESLLRTGAVILLLAAPECRSLLVEDGAGVATGKSSGVVERANRPKHVLRRSPVPGRSCPRNPASNAPTTAGSGRSGIFAQLKFDSNASLKSYPIRGTRTGYASLEVRGGGNVSASSSLSNLPLYARPWGMAITFFDSDD